MQKTDEKVKSTEVQHMKSILAIEAVFESGPTDDEETEHYKFLALAV